MEMNMRNELLREASERQQRLSSEEIREGKGKRKFGTNLRNGDRDAYAEHIAETTHNTENNEQTYSGKRSKQAKNLIQISILLRGKIKD